MVEKSTSSIPKTKIDGRTINDGICSVVVKDSRDILPRERIGRVGNQHTSFSFEKERIKKKQRKREGGKSQREEHTDRAVAHHHDLHVLPHGRLFLRFLKAQDEKRKTNVTVVGCWPKKEKTSFCGTNKFQWTSSSSFSCLLSCRHGWPCPSSEREKGSSPFLIFFSLSFFLTSFRFPSRNKELKNESSPFLVLLRKNANSSSTIYQVGSLRCSLFEFMNLIDIFQRLWNQNPRGSSDSWLHSWKSHRVLRISSEPPWAERVHE